MNKYSVGDRFENNMFGADSLVVTGFQKTSEGKYEYQCDVMKGDTVVMSLVYSEVLLDKKKKI